jgi:hypothetical protein
LWDFGDVELEIAFVLEAFEEELVFSLGERCYISQFAIDTQADMDILLVDIIVDI